MNRLIFILLTSVSLLITAGCTSLQHSDRGINVPRPQAEFFMNNPDNERIKEHISETYTEFYSVFGTQKVGHWVASPTDPFGNYFADIHEKYQAKKYVNVTIDSYYGIPSIGAMVIPLPIFFFWNARTVTIEADIVE